MDEDQEERRSRTMELAVPRQLDRLISVHSNFEDENEKKALDFQESDPAFRVFICNYPVAPVFFAISMVELFLLLSALLFTIAQLILHSSSSNVDEMEFINRTILPSTPKMTTAIANSIERRRLSWASAIFYWEPSWWYALAYLRLIVAVVAVCSVLCGLFGLWRQRRRFLLATSAAHCGLILFLLGYMALLAWHAVKFDDYFAFCIGGLTLLSLLLISVMGLHAAVISHKYLRSMDTFMVAAKNRWPDAYEEAVRVVRRRCSERNGLLSTIYRRLTRRYAVVKELIRSTTAELQVMHRSKIVLHDIEEADGEELEDQRNDA